jgi:hypothetical protein
MTMSPGWYPDQAGAPLEREWDGSKWTGATRPVAKPASAAPVKQKLELTLFGRVLALAGAMAGIILLVVAFVMLTPAGDAGGGSSDRYDADNQYEAIAQCESRIERLLKAPATADFNSSASGGGTWTVTGTVDSENSFGAQIRSTYQCTVVNNGNGTLTTTVDSLD